MKKIISIMLAVLLATALTVPVVSAANDNAHTITITNTDSSVKHVYEAYQVFKGDLNSDHSIMSNIEWGDGVDGNALLEDLIATNADDFGDCATAYDVAGVLVTYLVNNNSTDIDNFAVVVGKHLATVAATSTEDSDPYTLSVTGDGYYFVKDKNDSVTVEGESYSKYMLSISSDTPDSELVIEAKDEHLVPEKKILENGGKVSENAAAIGDVITYEVTIDLPKMDGYKAYTFTMNDTLSKGLTFTKYSEDENVHVVVNVDTAQNLTEGDENGYTVETVKNADGTTSLTVDFKNFIRFKRFSNINGKVVLTYKATLNDDAVIGVEGNPNTVDFIYSNNSSSTSQGDGGETGITPESETITYTTGLNLLKVDKTSQNELAGAKFKIEGQALNTVKTKGTKFVTSSYTADDNETIDSVDPETYYLLSNGTYSTTEPADYTGDTYVLVHFTKYTYKASAEQYDGTTGPDGIIRFEGLKPGSYTLTELEAPDGYNILQEPIDFEVTWDATNGFNISGASYDEETDTFEIKVENSKGSILPHTGGIGTTIFMVIGAFLVLGAAVVLVSVIVSRRRENV